MVKLTKAQRALLNDVAHLATIRNGGFYLRDMRRNQAGIELERLGLVTRGYPEPTGWPRKNRILMKITDAGRAALSAPASDGSK